MADTVNLDALIPRQDFRTSEAPQGSSGGEKGKGEASVTDLTEGEVFFSTLRKPDFQRETSAWSPAMVCDFVKAFIEQDLIPSVICWQSPSRLSFVIDGAHRLSAIMAWILNDYGDGDLSKKQYAYNIPDDQAKIAEKTRKLIDDQVGSYAQFRAAVKVPGSVPKVESVALNLASSVVPLLWVKGNDPDKAERAFFTINQSAVAIDPTELRILDARTKPNAIASRAVVRNAAGHKYWDKFSPAGQEEVVKEAKAVYQALYTPPLQTVHSEELPVAGRGYGTDTLPLIFDFVNIGNKLPVTDVSKSKYKFAAKQAEAPDEAKTLEVLGRTEKLCRRFTGTHAGSLGLHPAVYFYSSNGKHQPTTVLAMAQLLMDLDAGNKFNDFTKVRSVFENFLVSHKMYINQLTRRYGSMVKGYLQIRDYYQYILDCLWTGMGEVAIEAALKEHPKYQILVKEKPVLSIQNKKISQEAKQLKLLSDVLEKAFVCNLCHARIDKKAMQLGHTVDKKDGGLAQTQNTEWQHPYCNSTFKTWLEQTAQMDIQG